MTIEFENTSAPKTHSAVGVAIAVTACAFFFIPTTLIILGYYSSQPTGTLISPLPQGVLSDSQPTPEIANNQPIIAAENTATEAATSSVVPDIGSNLTNKEATIEANLTESIIKDPSVTEATQIFLTPREGDKDTYYVKSKTVGEFTITSNTASDVVRHIDYHLVTP